MATIRINITGAVDPEFNAALEKTAEAAKAAQGKITRGHVSEEKKKTDATQKEAEKRARIERQAAREQKRHIDSLHREQADKDRERTSRARSQDTLDERRRNNERKARNNRRTEERAIERDEQHIAKQADVRRAKIAADDKRAQAEFKRWHNNKQKLIADGAAAEQKSAHKTATEASRAADKQAKAADKLARTSAAEQRKAQAQSARRSQQAQTLLMMGGAAAVGLAGAAWNVGSQIAGAAGVHTDLGSVFGGAFELGNKATDLSNQAYIPGDQRNDRVIDPTVLRRESLDVAGKTGFSGNDVMSGLQAFVAKTGDLSTARDVIQDIAKLSKATGANLEQMASASADVSTQLGDVPDKANVVADVMKTIAAQGKMGAVEIKDLASKMASLAASAGKFEGARSENIKKFGALIQLARARGGATSAAESATSLQALSTQFQKSARQKGFAALGVETKGADGRFRDLPDVLMDVLFKTRGDLRKSQQAIGDQRAQKPYLGMQDIFLTERAARMKNASFGVGMGDKEREELAATEAIARVREEFDKLYKAQVNNAEIERAFQAAMQTAASRANDVNVQFEKVATELSGNFMEAIVELAPAILAIADFAGDALLGADKWGKVKLESAASGMKEGQAQAKAIYDHFPELNPNVQGPFQVSPERAKQIEGARGDLKRAEKRMVSSRGKLLEYDRNRGENYSQPLDENMPIESTQGSDQNKLDSENYLRLISIGIDELVRSKGRNLVVVKESPKGGSVKDGTTGPEN